MLTPLHAATLISSHGFFSIFIFGSLRWRSLAAARGERSSYVLWFRCAFAQYTTKLTILHLVRIRWYMKVIRINCRQSDLIKGWLNSAILELENASKDTDGLTVWGEEDLKDLRDLKLQIED